MNEHRVSVRKLPAKVLRKLLSTGTQIASRRMLRHAGAQVGARVKIIGSPIVTLYESSNISISDDVVLCSDSRYTALGVAKPVILRTMAPGASIKIGKHVGLSGTVICSAVSVSIGDNCLIGADVTIADTDFHPVSPASGRRYATMPIPQAGDAISVGADVFIGAGVHVLKGVTIGRGAVVGSRSVVTRDVPPMTIVAGNPARPVGTVTE